MTEFEKHHPTLHEFFCAGGQVHLLSSSNHALYPSESEKTRMDELHLISECQSLTTPIPHYTVDELSKLLNITYRATIELVGMLDVGGIKTTKGYKIYKHSVSIYLDKLSNVRNKEWYDAKI